MLQPIIPQFLPMMTNDYEDEINATTETIECDGSLKLFSKTYL